MRGPPGGLTRVGPGRDGQRACELRSAGGDGALIPKRAASAITSRAPVTVVGVTLTSSSLGTPLREADGLGRVGAHVAPADHG